MLLSLAILAGGLAEAGPLHAGVYNLDPPRSSYPSSIVEAGRRYPKSVRDHRGQLQAIDDRASNRTSALQPGYLQQTMALQARRKAGTLSAEDRTNLGACLIRLGRLDEARRVLEEAERVIHADSPYRFFVLLNLASVYQEDPDLLARAIDTQTRALKSWPAVWAGWNRQESEWYRRVETYVLRLMHLRQAEIRIAGGRPGPYQTVDDLFPGVRFVGPDGAYEAGAIDFDIWNKLPPDAESIVIQMMLWQPRDNRLYWLYGELLNARGQVADAFAVLNPLDDIRTGSPRELHAHRNILQMAQKSLEFWDYPNWPTLSWVVAPRGQLLPPGVGGAAYEMGWAAMFTSTDPAAVTSLPAAMPTEPSAPSPPAASGVLPDWRLVTVSFVTGMVVAVLAMLQWQQWRRRREDAPPRRVPADRDGPSAGTIAGSSRYSRPTDG
jgi:tetratricopeptide (TPR) repeat protein